jgi:3-dehydroquinate dehydratase/shikimate dehydrogenase
MARICLCLTGETLSRNLAIVEKYRSSIDIAELRVDCLDPDERFLIRDFPVRAGLPVILTIRRRIDGGYFDNGEGSRVSLFSRGLAFAEVDRRRNFAYVDLEEDLDVPSLEEAARTFGTRIIRSCHNMNGIYEDMAKKIRGLVRIGDEIAKLAVMPRDLGDVIKVYQAARKTAGMEKIILCMGEAGTNTRILAAHMGSFLSYTSVPEPDLPQAAPGQIDPETLVKYYRFRDVTAKTKIYGVTGFPLKTTFSPRIFNSVFNHEKINAVYVPFPAHNLNDFLHLAAELHIAGVSVTIPYKEEILPHLRGVSETVRKMGACNTIKADRSLGWDGINTDTQGFSESLLSFTGKKNFRGMKVTVIGAGGAARAAVSEIFRLKGKCLILNRNSVRSRELALKYQYKWGGLDSQALDTMERYSDIIIQTTPVGTYPNIDDDPFELYHFKGHETVMDLIYNPEETAFLQRAKTAGCRILNGLEMLIRQAKYQYQYFLEKDFPEQLIPRLGEIIRSKE